MSRFKLESVHLECKHIRELLNPVNLLSFNVIAVFLRKVINRALVLTIPNGIEVFTGRYVKQDVWKIVTAFLLAWFTIFIFKFYNSPKLSLECWKNSIFSAFILLDLIWNDLFDFFVLHDLIKMFLTETTFSLKAGIYLVITYWLLVNRHRIRSVFPLVLTKILKAFFRFKCIWDTSKQHFIEFSDVFFLSYLDPLPKVINNWVQDSTWVNILFISLCHPCEEFLQLSYELLSWLNFFLWNGIILFAVRSWLLILRQRTRYCILWVWRFNIFIFKI